MSRVFGSIHRRPEIITDEREKSIVSQKSFTAAMPSGWRSRKSAPRNASKQSESMPRRALFPLLHRVVIVPQAVVQPAGGGDVADHRVVDERPAQQRELPLLVLGEVVE